MKEEKLEKTLLSLQSAKSEIRKAEEDMMAYGTGAVFVPNNQEGAKHIPLKDIAGPDKETL